MAFLLWFLFGNWKLLCATLASWASVLRCTHPTKTDWIPSLHSPMLGFVGIVVTKAAGKLEDCSCGGWQCYTRQLHVPCPCQGT